MFPPSIRYSTINQVAATLNQVAAWKDEKNSGNFDFRGVRAPLSRTSAPLMPCFRMYAQHLRECALVRIHTWPFFFTLARFSFSFFSVLFCRATRVLRGKRHPPEDWWGLARVETFGCTLLFYQLG